MWTTKAMYASSIPGLTLTVMISVTMSCGEVSVDVPLITLVAPLSTSSEAPLASSERRASDSSQAPSCSSVRNRWTITQSACMGGRYHHGADVPGEGRDGLVQFRQPAGERALRAPADPDGGDRRGDPWSSRLYGNGDPFDRAPANPRENPLWASTTGAISTVVTNPFSTTTRPSITV